MLNKEMDDIYKILQTDMSKILSYLTTVEEKKKKE